MSELRVRAPASSANLGPGFDSFAIALPLLAEFEVRPARAWTVSLDGNGEERAPDDDLFVIAARAVARVAKEHLGPQHVTQRSAIPLGRGLGSSAGPSRQVSPRRTPSSARRSTGRRCFAWRPRSKGIPTTSRPRSMAA